MWRNMDQGTNPKFSHITVGKTGFEDTSQLEDEEVLTIGAVDLSAEQQQPAQESSNSGTVAKDVPKQVRKKDKDDSGPKLTEQDEEEAFGAPMPFAQKIVVIACAIGFLVVIIFLIWYWLIRP